MDDPQEFEEEVGAAPDEWEEFREDADLTVRHDSNVIVIQWKRYVSAVVCGPASKNFHEADEAWVITDSTFTKAARKLAQSASVRLKILMLRPRK